MTKLKWFLPLVAILLVAVGVFAMNAKSNTTKTEVNIPQVNTTLHAPLVNYKWFRINTNLTPGANVTNSDATYLTGKDGPTPPTGENCPDGSSYQCVSGFDPSTQVNSSNQIISSQKPAVEASQRD